MIVTCGDCGASFNLDDRHIKPGGTKVRCSKCQSVFVVTPQQKAPIDLVSQVEEKAIPAIGAGAGLKAELPGTEDIEATLNDFFGEEDGDAGMDALGELTDLDFESAELKSDTPDGEDGGEFSLDLEPSAEDLSVAADAGGDRVPAGGADDLGLDLLGDDEAALDNDDLPELDDLLDLSEENLDLDAEDLAMLDEQIGEVDAALETAGEDALNLVDPDGDRGLVADPTGGDDLDLDLDLGLGMENGGSEDAEDTASDEDELVLDLGGTQAAPEKAGTETASGAADVDEIDLSDIEEMLADDDLEAPPAPGGSGEDTSLEEVEEFDLSDFARELADEDDAAAAENADADDLELDLDLDLDEQPAAESAAAAAGPPADELDFSDLADVLEPETMHPEAAAVNDAGDDGFELDLGLEESPAAAETASPGTADDGELDLDSMLDQDEPAAGEEELDLTLEFDGLGHDTPPQADDQPELEFDLEAELDERTARAGGEDELELNLLEDEDTIALAEGGTTAIAGATAGMATGVQEIGATTDDFATEEFTDARALTGDADLMAAEDDDLEQLAAGPRRTRKPLVYALVALVVLLAALILPSSLGVHVPVLSDIKIPYLSDIRIPYLSGWFGGDDAADPGSLKIIPLEKTINAKVVDNQQSGKLLVISGQVRNEYGHPRSFIQLTGKLFTRDGAMAKSATVYAGNMISTLDLSRLDYGKIQAQLQNKSGQRKSNLNVKQSRVVPFMIVFDQLPAALEEYTVEVAGSAKQ